MKRILYLLAVVLVVFNLLPAVSVFSQTDQVPIRYDGDTGETIARRAKWIEGAQQEKELMWWSSQTHADLAAITAEFNKIYPFIKVNFWRGQDSERNMRVAAEHAVGRLSVDVIQAGGMLDYPGWRKIGLLEKFVHIVPGIDTVNPRRYSKHGDWMQHGNQILAPLYNTNLVSSDDAPKSWEDLLDPKWKGHIGITSDPKAWYMLALADGGWGIEKTETFLRKLRDQELLWAKGHSAGFTLLIAGEFKIFAEGYPRHIWRLEGKAVPVEWVRVNPVPVSGSTLFMPKNPPHPNAAWLFMEWIFSPQGARVIDRITGHGSTDPASGTKLSKAVKGLDLVIRDEELMVKVEETGIIKRIQNALGMAN